MSRTTRTKINTGWNTALIYEPGGRDGKPWFKPDGKFKNAAKKSRRAKQRQAFREGKEAPRERHENEWNYI